MSRPHSGLILVLLAGMSLATVGQAASPSQIEFSADFYQTGASGGESGGRIFVGKGNVRTEMTQNGQQMIQIVDTKNQITRMIIPAQRSYMEQEGAGPPPGMGSAKGGEVNPCEGMRGAQCERLGTEKVGGRAAVKWEVSIDRQGKTLTSSQWIDQERGIPLRQEMPNGQQMELKMLGQEEMEGRRVEKWEMQMSQPDQASQSSYRWFDPELNMIIREEFPGGFVRGMRNIRIGAQDTALFKVPAGFKKITPQQKAPAMRQ
jgi:hypothetical protein